MGPSYTNFCDSDRVPHSIGEDKLFFGWRPVGDYRVGAGEPNLERKLGPTHVKASRVRQHTQVDAVETTQKVDLKIVQSQFRPDDLKFYLKGLVGVFSSVNGFGRGVFANKRVVTPEVDSDLAGRRNDVQQLQIGQRRPHF